MTSEIEEKTERIVATLNRERLDAVLLNAQHNFAWLTGGGSNGVDLSRENGVASLLVTSSGRRFLLASKIEMPRMLAEEVSADDFEPVEFGWQPEKVGGYLPETAGSLIESRARLGTDIPLKASVPVIESKITSCRYELTDHELSRYRQLGRDAGTAIRKVIGRLEPGESELAVAEKIRQGFAADRMTTVVTLVGADDRISNFRHPLPTENKWRETLLLVACAKRGGLIVSLSRIVHIGAVPDELGAKTEAAAYVNACLLNATSKDTTGADLYETAASAYAERGFADEIDRHHQGGAGGYKPREWVAHPQSTETVRLNQAFAWNPSIKGTKIEETCITTENGVEIVTTSPDFPQISTVIEGREYISPGILSL